MLSTLKAQVKTKIKNIGCDPTAFHRMSRDLDMWGNRDGETYRCDWCAAEYDDDSEDDESLSVYEAAEIWASNGKDEDYMFGYSEDELEAAL